MHAPALKGREARELLDKVLSEEKTNQIRLDRDIFEEAYGPFDYKKHFDRFNETGELPPEVAAHCHEQLRRGKL